MLLVVGALSALGISDAVQGSPVAATSSTTTTTTTQPPPTTAITTPPTTTVPPPSATTPTASPVPNPSGTYPTPSTAVGPAGGFVTPAVVADVLSTTWQGYAQAMTADDRAALVDFTSPTGLSDSTATLDCGCLSGPLTYTTAVTSVPPQSGYPLTFLEGLSGTAYDQQPLTRWVVFTKQDAPSPWVVSTVASYVNGGGLDGFTPFSTLPPFAVAHPLSAGPQAFADFFQDVDSTGDPGSGLPTDFAHSPILDTDVSGSVNWVARLQAAGLTDRYTHTIDGVSPVFAQVVDGTAVGAMSCFSMRLVEVITSADGTPVVQAAEGGLFGALVPPGSYGQVTLTAEDDTCIGEDSGGGLTVLADSGGTFAATTTPTGS
jgi:hypothetical protein